MPLPLEEIAAVEIFARGRSHRFERDPSGAWLLHRHAPGDDPNMLHRADPAQSERIARVLSAFSRTPIERTVAEAAPSAANGLVDPEAILLLFTDDPARPPLDYGIGEPVDGASRYVLMPDHIGIVTVPEAQIAGLIDFVGTLEP